MSCLVESIAEAMKNLPILSTYTSADGMKYREDSNLKDVCHLAETIRRVCNLAIDDLSSIQSLSKQQVIEIVELVEYELLSQPSIEPVKCSVVSDPLAIRVKQENQLIDSFFRNQQLRSVLPYFFAAYITVSFYRSNSIANAE
jgi:hypothetical protein